MIGLLVRLAVLGGAWVVALNVVTTWVRALAAPKKALALPVDIPPSQARNMVEEATRRANRIRVKIACLKDPEMWQAVIDFSLAVGRLCDAELSSPDRYRLVRR